MDAATAERVRAAAVAAGHDPDHMIRLARGILGECGLEMLVFHTCGARPVEARPFLEAGYVRAPWRCPRCKALVADPHAASAGVTYDLAERA